MLLSLRRAGRVLPCLLLVAAVAAPPARAVTPSWPSAGQNLSNTHNNPQETDITVNRARRLAVKWTAQVHGDVSATPAVVDDAVYFPDWGGYLNKLDAKTGAKIWSIKLADLAGEPAGAVSRTGPAVSGGTVFIGDQNGAHLLAIDAATGALKWSSQLDTHPLAILTQSPLVSGGVVYEGVASLEEAAAADPSYPCCSFQGSVSAVNATTGAVLWKTKMLPDNGGGLDGFTGAGVWGSTAALDPATNSLYETTGNNYSVPDAVKQCQADGGTNCLPPDNMIDSVVALNSSTGAVKWSFNAAPGFDDWNVACIFFGGGVGNCPENPGPDFDFGNGPNLLTTKIGGATRKIVGAGQKSGAYWALDAASGQLLWGNQAGPGSTLGGIEWGSSTDGTRIYIAEADFFGIPYQLPKGQTITSGSFAALDPATGHIIWQIADPSGDVDLAGLSSANGVLYAGSMSGHMYAIDAANGTVLKDIIGQGASNAAPAVVQGTVFWGNGYSHLGIPGWNGSTTFYAFSAG
jgi:polyvinyl alcohol dehydrogenase (cytochrome)